VQRDLETETARCAGNVRGSCSTWKNPYRCPAAIPEALNDRAADIWNTARPGRFGGRSWPELARKAQYT